MGLMLAGALVLQILTAVAPADPFAFFRPAVTITAADRRQLDRGEAIARVLPGNDLQVAVFAAVPPGTDGDRLVAWIRRIEDLKKSSYVLAIRRFSNPPRIEDLAGATLDEEDLLEVRGCRPGKCGLKLSAGEMTALRNAAAKTGGDWRPAVQEAFRRIVLRRVETYVARGEVAAYEDRNKPVWPAIRFVNLLEQSKLLTERLPKLAAHLRGYPQAADPEVESFLYWSKERLARKAIVSVTHISIARSHEPALPDALVIGKDIFSTHYVDASLSLTAIMRGDSGGSNYLAYLNRSEVDVLDGAFGRLIRRLMQRRLKAEAAGVIQSLGRRLEASGPPAR